MNHGAKAFSVLTIALEQLVELIHEDDVGHIPVLAQTTQRFGQGIARQTFSSQLGGIELNHWQLQIFGQSLEQMGFARARGASQMEVWADLALGLCKHLQGLVDLGSNLLLLREYELHGVSR